MKAKKVGKPRIPTAWRLRGDTIKKIAKISTKLQQAESETIEMAIDVLDSQLKPQPKQQ